MLVNCVWKLDLFILEIPLPFLSTLQLGKRPGCVGLVVLRVTAGLNIRVLAGFVDLLAV